MRLGVDLGGTKIEIIALDDSGKELLRRRVFTPSGNYAATLQLIGVLVHDAEAKLGQRGSVGIGTPGTLSRATGRLKNSNSVILNDKPILQDLESLLQRPVKISNDANCFALSEAMDGAAAGAAVVFGVILGTGVGAGIVVNGQVLTGPNGIAGEWGHNPLPWPKLHELPGPQCYCGKQGCIETFLSGPGMVQLHQRETGVSLSAEEIVARAEEGDTACESQPATLRKSPRAFTRARHQHPRPGCHRAGRRHVQYRTAVCERARNMGRTGCFRTGWIRNWCSTAMAIPAACAGRHGYKTCLSP